MKCFHFSGDEVAGESSSGGSTASRLSWARSLSIASTSSSLGFDAPRPPAPAIDPVWPPPQPEGLPEGLRAFGFAELKAATKGFSRALLIGEGGFGRVYRGVVSVEGEDGAGEMDVAVKQLNRHGLQGHTEWVTEVNFLGVVKHPNLVKLVGYCAEDDERGIQRLLVYELMHNKSLEDHLLSRVSSILSWTLRLRIAQDAARGLAYLHEEMEYQLIFRDFKTSNILLDRDFNGKVSDFGFVRYGPAGGIGHISTSVVGTVGYAAPEYVHTGKLTAKSDVWSFGVVLYELLTGRRSVDKNLPRSEQKLLDWVRPYATDPKRLHMIVDQRLQGKYCAKSAQMLVALANRCLLKQPKSRPKMSEIVEMLDEIIVLSNAANEEAAISSNVCLVDETTDTSRMLKEKGSHRSHVFDIREMMSLRSRSMGKVYWKVLVQGLS